MLKMILLRKAVYDKLVTTVNDISTSEFILKINYQTDKAELEMKIHDVTDLVKKQNSLNRKMKIIILVVKQQKIHKVQSKIKYMMLVILLKKANLTKKLVN